MIKPKNPPYDGTEVDPNQSRVEIDKLLRSYGIQKIIWASDYERNDVQLAFETEAEIQGVRKIFTVMLRPPLILKNARIYNRQKGVTEKVKIPDWPRSMRILFWYVKAKIEAVAYGLASVEKEFLSQVIVSLPDGNRTVGEVLEPIMLDEKLSTIPALLHIKKVEVVKEERIIDV
ncbi:MAG: hypothetical protein QG670_1934 [Thermoproteota archaeon]|nr:hypothetical protein [Thermoproteota archaeon]